MAVSESSCCIAGHGKEASTKIVTTTYKGVTKTMQRRTTIPTLLRTTHQTTKSTGELQEEIRRRAYELYEQRGRDDGHETDDWLQAESEVTQQKARTVAA